MTRNTVRELHLRVIAPACDDPETVKAEDEELVAGALTRATTQGPRPSVHAIKASKWSRISMLICIIAFCGIAWFGVIYLAIEFLHFVSIREGVR